MQEKNKQEENKIYNLYLVCGEEDYLRDYYKKRLLDKLMPSNETINYRRFSSEKIDISEVIEFSDTMPFLSEYRLACLDKCGLFVSGTKPQARSSKELVEYLKKNNTDTRFVFIEKDVDKLSALYKHIKKEGKVLSYDRRSDADLANWILKQVISNNYEINRNTAYYFLEMVGNNMQIISNELKKLYAYKMNDTNKSITKENIDAICSTSIQNKIFEMINNISKKNKSKALEIYADLIYLKEPPQKILSLLNTEYKNLIAIKSAIDNRLGNVQIEKQTGIQPNWKVRKYMQTANNMSVGELNYLLNYLVDIDERIKTGLLDADLAVDLFIGEACKK